MKTFKNCSLLLWISLGLGLLTILSFFVGDYRFYADNHTYQLFTWAGLFVGVLYCALALAAARKLPQQLQAVDDIQERFAAYRRSYVSLYAWGLAASALLSLLILLSHNRSLIPLLLVTMLLLFFLHPTLIKAKTELHLTTEEMQTLFGDKYIE